MATTQRKLPGRLRKGVLQVHIISVGTWFGIDVVLAVLVFTALLTDDANVAITSLGALELFAVWPMLAASLLSLASGVVLGLGSKWGVLRYWWVTVKFVINLVMSALIVLALRPGVGDAAEYARRLAAGDATATMPDDLIFPPIVSLALLLVAFTLSVFKPWGRLRTSPAMRRNKPQRPSDTRRATRPVREHRVG